MIETVGQRKALDLAALDSGRTIGHQRELDAKRLQRIDRVMRARKHEHLFFPEGGEAIGVQMGNGSGRQVAPNHGRPRMSLAPGGDEGVGQLAGLAAIGEQAGLELQEGGHGLVSGSSMPVT